MNVTLEIELPRQTRAITVLRHAVGTLCTEIGVYPDDVHDLTLALSEACNNVVTHAKDDDTFTVRFQLRDLTASVHVVNERTPYLSDAFAGTEPVDPLSESGRGVAIMRALVDEARFTPSPDGGTLVELTRAVAATENSLLADSVS
ncbi:ATP-binding protein [Euzebya sp.]|uniref:ATP-binding protein n=1 Tax=Euzebya sp. TaxID=1971409 RepID=UPI003511EA21